MNGNRVQINNREGVAPFAPVSGCSWNLKEHTSVFTGAFGFAVCSTYRKPESSETHDPRHPFLTICEHWRR